jgi:hypothetical protein
MGRKMRRKRRKGIEKNPKAPKIAVCYRGHYFRRGGKYIGKNKGSNFFLCYWNHMDYLFPHLGNFDVFFHTYSCSTEANDKLLNLLKPKKYIIDDEVSNQHQPGANPKVNYTMMQSNSLVDMDEYDFVINLRFDLLFLRPWIDFNAQQDKFNFLFKSNPGQWKRNGISSDLLWGFPPKYSDAWEASLNATSKKSRVGDGHWIYRELSKSIGEESLHFMLPGHHHSSTRHHIPGREPTPNLRYNGFIELNRRI